MQSTRGCSTIWGHDAHSRSDSRHPPGVRPRSGRRGQRLVPAAPTRAAARLRRAGLPRGNPYPPCALAGGDARGGAPLRRARRPERPPGRHPAAIPDRGAPGGPLPRPGAHAPQPRQRADCPTASRPRLAGLDGCGWGAGTSRGLHREAPPGHRPDRPAPDPAGGPGHHRGSAGGAGDGGGHRPAGWTSGTGTRTGRRSSGPWSRASWMPTGWTTCSGTPSIPE